MADEDFKDVKVLHKEEVKQHSDSNSPYLIIDNKVYDVSKFLEEVNRLKFHFEIRFKHYIYNLILLAILYSHVYLACEAIYPSFKYINFFVKPLNEFHNV